MRLQRPNLDFDYDVQSRNQVPYTELRQHLRDRGFNFEETNLHLGSGEFGLDTRAIAIKQQIKNEERTSYIFSGYAGALYAASDKNLTSIRPVMSYASLDNGKVQIKSPMQRILDLVANPTQTNHSGKTTALTTLLQQQGADAIPIGRLTHQGNLEEIFAHGYQLGGPKNQHQQIVDLLNSNPSRKSDPLLRYNGVGTAIPASAYAGVVPGAEYSENGVAIPGLLMSKPKRLRLYKGDIGGALLRSGEELSPGTESFYAGNQKVPGRAYGITASFDVFSNLPEGQGLTRDLYAYRQFASPVQMPQGSTYDPKRGVVLPTGEVLGKGSYFGQRLGAATEGMNRLGSTRDFRSLFNRSLGNIRTGIVNEIEPEFDAMGNFSGRAKLGIQRVTDALVFKQGGTKLSLLHTKQDLGADILARFPERSELPAFALQVLKGEIPDSKAFEQWFSETAEAKGHEPYWATRMYRNGIVDPRAMPMVTEAAIDRVLSRLQYTQKQDVELTPMQYEAMQGKSFITNLQDPYQAAQIGATPITSLPPKPDYSEMADKYFLLGGVNVTQDKNTGWEFNVQNGLVENINLGNIESLKSPTIIGHAAQAFGVKPEQVTDRMLEAFGTFHEFSHVHDLELGGQDVESFISPEYQTIQQRIASGTGSKADWEAYRNSPFEARANKNATKAIQSLLGQGVNFGLNPESSNRYSVPVFHDNAKNVTQLENGNYQVSKFNDLRGTYQMAANFRPEFSKDTQQLGPYALNLLSQYNPDLFNAMTSIGKASQKNNSAYNIVSAYRANYEPEQYNALKDTFGIANLDMGKVKAIQQQLISENPNRPEGELLQETMRSLRETYGSQALQFNTPQGSVISPSARAILGSMTTADDGSVLPSWASKMAGLISQSAMGGGSEELAQMTSAAFNGIRGKNGENYGGLEQYANQKGVLKQAESLTLPKFGGAAYGAEGVGVDELITSRAYVSKMTGIEDVKQLYGMADSGQLSAAILRYPASNPREMTVNQRIKFYEDMPERFQQRYQNPGKNLYMSPDAMAAIHGDFDFDRVIAMTNVKAIGATGTFLGGALKVLPRNQILQTAKNKVESEYTKQLDIFNERNGFDIDTLRKHYSNPANLIGVKAADLAHDFMAEEQGSKGKVGILHDALLRNYGGAVNPTSETLFGSSSPLMENQRKSLGIMASYGQQKLLDIKGEQDQDLLSLIGISASGYRFNQKDGSGLYRVYGDKGGVDEATSDAVMGQKVFENFLNIGSQLDYSEYSKVGLPKSIASQIINRDTMSKLYSEGGEDAVKARVNKVAGMIRLRRGNGPSAEASQRILSLTGAKDFADWFTNAGSTGAQWISGSISANTYNIKQRDEDGNPIAGTHKYGFPAGFGWEGSGQSVLNARAFTPEVEKALNGVEALTSTKGGAAGMRNWIHSIFPGAGTAKQSFRDRLAYTAMAALDPAETYQSLVEQRNNLKVQGFAEDSQQIKTLDSKIEDASMTLQGIGTKSSSSNGGVFIPLPGMGAGSSSGGNVPPPESPSNSFAAAFSGGGGEDSSGSGSIGGSITTNNIMKTSMPKLSTKQIAEAVDAMANLSEAAKNLVSPMKDAREQAVKWYDSMKDIVSYGVRADQYGGIGQKESRALGLDPSYQAYQRYFGSQAGPLQRFVSENSGPAIDAAVKNYREDQAPTQAPQDLLGRIGSVASNLFERAIKGQGAFHAKLGYDMFTRPFVNMARDYMQGEASNEQLLYQAGQISSSDLSSGSFGTLARQRAAIEQIQLGVGRQTYSAYSPILSAAINSNLANGPLGAAAGIGIPSFGVGVAATSLFNPVVGSIAAGVTAGVGIGGYISSSSNPNVMDTQSWMNLGNYEQNYAQVSRPGYDGPMQGFLSDFQGSVGDLFSNDTTKGSAKAFYNAAQQVISGKMTPSQAAGSQPGYYSYPGALQSANIDDWIKNQGFKYDPSNPQSAASLMADQARQVVGGWLTYHQNRPSTDQSQKLLSTFFAGVDQSGLMQSYAQAYGISQYNLPAMAGLQESSLNAQNQVIAQGGNVGLWTQQQTQAAQSVTGANALARMAHTRQLDANYFSQLEQNNPDLAAAGVNLSTANSQMKMSNPAYYNAVENPVLNRVQKLYDQGLYGSGNTLINRSQNNEGLFNQLTAIGGNSQQVGQMIQNMVGLSSSSQYNLIQGAMSGNQMALSARGQQTGLVWQQQLNLQTGMSTTYQNVPQNTIDAIRQNDPYHMFRLNDQQAQIGTYGAQSQITLDQRLLQNAGWQASNQQRDIGYQLQYGNLNQAQQLMGQGNAYTGFAGTQLNTGNNMNYYQIQQAQWGITRSQQAFGLQQEGQQLGIAQQQYALTNQQFNANYGLQVQQFQYQTGFQRQQMQIDQSHTVQQEQWNTQDIAYNRSQLDVQFGWQMQDYDRNIRYARGMDKRNLMREQQRSVIQYSMQASHSDVEAGRNQTQIQWEEQDFQRKKQYFEQNTQFQQQSLDNQKKFFDLGQQLDKQRLDMQQQAHLKNVQWMQQEWQLEDQQRSLDRQFAEWQYQNQVLIDTKTQDVTKDINLWSDAINQVNQYIQTTIAYAQTLEGISQIIGGQAPPVTGDIGIGGHQGSAVSGYAGHGSVGVVHKGGDTSPQGNTTVVQGSNAEVSKKHDRMIQLLEKIADNPSSFQLVMDGQKSTAQPIYRQSKARL